MVHNNAYIYMRCNDGTGAFISFSTQRDLEVTKNCVYNSMYGDE